ncbi:MAG: DUF805 domain-containing protein [Planctomycetes bacterium]|nr:DUF805 domain-containing protein [Planctomycetota bacterium]
MPVRLFGSLAATLLLAAACAGEGEAEAGNEAAGENGARTFAQPSLTVETLEKIRTLIGEDLSKAFLVGDAEAAMALFNAHGDEEDRRQGSIHRALDREFHAQRYTRFELAELEPEEQLPSKEYNRHSVWVNLRLQHEDLSAKKLLHDYVYNGEFIVEVSPKGKVHLADSAFFDTLGQKQSADLAASTILTAILSLALLSFWVWMGVEAFRLRPRSTLWRLMMLVPVLGPLLYFVAVYLPGLRGAAEPTR